MTHLILHKVRGEPAFDIAEKIQIGDEEGWIIPTSGHRAYPFWHWPVDKLVSPFPPVDLPTDWPDHYACNDDGGVAPEPSFNMMAIVGRLLPRIKRRL